MKLSLIWLARICSQIGPVSYGRRSPVRFGVWSEDRLQFRPCLWTTSRLTPDRSVTLSRTI